MSEQKLSLYTWISQSFCAPWIWSHFDALNLREITRVCERLQEHHSQLLLKHKKIALNSRPWNTFYHAVAISRSDSHRWTSTNRLYVTISEDGKSRRSSSRHQIQTKTKRSKSITVRIAEHIFHLHHLSFGARKTKTCMNCVIFISFDLLLPERLFLPCDSGNLWSFSDN